MSAPRESQAPQGAAGGSSRRRGTAGGVRAEAAQEWAPGELEAIEAALQADVARLRDDLLVAEEDIAGLIADSGEGAGDDQADTGSKTFEREHEMSLTANTRDLLDQSLKALSRLADGTYGVCENCGGPIGKGRLKAFPRATLCIECKQREERR